MTINECNSSCAEIVKLKSCWSCYVEESKLSSQSLRGNTLIEKKNVSRYFSFHILLFNSVHMFYKISITAEIRDSTSNRNVYTVHRKDKFPCANRYNCHTDAAKMRYTKRNDGKMDKLLHICLLGVKKVCLLNERCTHASRTRTRSPTSSSSFSLFSAIFTLSIDQIIRDYNKLL